MNYITLNNNIKIPQEGYGVFQISDLKQCEECVSNALETGYRLIDTASVYMNEKAVGEAIKNSGVDRSDLFITTKLWVQDAGYENTKRAFESSLKNLKLDYIDLYLIHQPFGDYYGSWRAMEELLKEGLIKSIGVCNFDSARFVDLCMNNKIKPAVNQIEIHPFFQQEQAIKVMREYHTAPQAWGPLSEGQKDIFNNKTLLKIAQKYNKTTAQVILRWHIQRDVIIIPKTVRKERMAENINIWDFELSQKDMSAIAEMDIGHSEIIDHHTAATAKQLNNLKIH